MYSIFIREEPTVFFSDSLLFALSFFLFLHLYLCFLFHFLFFSKKKKKYSEQIGTVPTSQIKTTERKETKPKIEEQPFLPDQLDDRGMESLLSEFLENQQLDLFPEKMLTEAVKVFVDKDEKDAIKEYFLVISFFKKNLTLFPFRINETQIDLF